MLRFIAHGRLHRTQNALSTVFYAPRLARSSVPGLLPGTRRTRDIPTEFRATSACHRQFGGDVGPRGPSRGLAPHAASQAYRPTSRARMPCIGGRSGGQAKAHSVAKLRGGFAEEAGFASTDRSEHVARPRPHLSKRPRKRPWDGRLRRRKYTERNCGTRGAPQKRRLGCMDWLHYVGHFYEGRGSGFANASRGPRRRRAAHTTTP